MAIYDAPESLHVGTGTETVFGFNWPYLLPRDLLVTVNGLPVPTVLASPNQVAIVPAPAALTIVRIYRNTPAQNPTYLFATGIPMLPKYIDGNNKQLLYALQEGLLQFAQTQATADAALEAARLAQIAAEQAATSAAQQAQDMRRTVRVPTTDPEIPALPTVAARANKVLGFDAAGQPVGILPATGSGTEVALDLANTLDPAKGAGMSGWSRRVAGAANTTVGDKLDQLVISVRDFGAIGDGVTDDTVACQATLDYARTLVRLNGERHGYVAVDFTNTGTSKYKITNTLRYYTGVTINGCGSELVVSIAAYPRIRTPTAVPEDFDVNGQLGGAAFSDHNFADPTAIPADTSGCRIAGFRITGARWAIAAAGRLIAPQFEDIVAWDCNAAIFTYGAIQLATIRNIETAGGTNVGVIGSAACYTENHPWRGRDTNFVASPTITNTSHSVGLVYNVDLDNWFRDAILRPTRNAYRAGINFGVMEYDNPDALNVSGRFVYFPSRTKNANFHVIVDGPTFVGCPRGLMYLARANGGYAANSSAEAFAINASVQALGAEVNYVELYRPTTYHVENIGIEPVSGGASYKYVVQLTTPESYAGNFGTSVTAMNVSGRMEPRLFDLCVVKDTYSNPRAFRVGPSARAMKFLPRPEESTYNVTTAVQTSPSENSKYVSMSGDMLNMSFVAARLPQVGGVQTLLQMWNDAVNGSLDRQGNYMGKVTVYCQDLLTGAMDFAEYVVHVPGRFASSQLNAAGVIGDTSVALVSTSVNTAYHPGDSITIGGVDRYLVSAVLPPSTLVLATPLRVAYNVGQPVVGVGTLVRTLSAPLLSYFALTVDANSIRITNTRGVPGPIKLYVKLESVKDQNSYLK